MSEITFEPVSREEFKRNKQRQEHGKYLQTIEKFVNTGLELARISIAATENGDTLYSGYKYAVAHSKYKDVVAIHGNKRAEGDSIVFERLDLKNRSN